MATLTERLVKIITIFLPLVTLVTFLKKFKPPFYLIRIIIFGTMCAKSHSTVEGGRMNLKINDQGIDSIAIIDLIDYDDYYAGSILPQVHASRITNTCQGCKHIHIFPPPHQAQKTSCDQPNLPTSFPLQFEHQEGDDDMAHNCGQVFAEDIRERDFFPANTVPLRMPCHQQKPSLDDALQMFASMGQDQVDQHQIPQLRNIVEQHPSERSLQLLEMENTRHY